MPLVTLGADVVAGHGGQNQQQRVGGFVLRKWSTTLVLLLEMEGAEEAHCFSLPTLSVPQDDDSTSLLLLLSWRQPTTETWPTRSSSSLLYCNCASLELSLSLAACVRVKPY